MIFAVFDIADIGERKTNRSLGRALLLRAVAMPQRAPRLRRNDVELGLTVTACVFAVGLLLLVGAR